MRSDSKKPTRGKSPTQNNRKAGSGVSKDKPFRGERKERTFGNREDKPFRGERKERTFGNREDKPFRGERKERTFGNREDKPFRGERKERTFGNREDKPFRGERKERTFGNREDKPFRGERKERTFGNREDKPFRGERKERTFGNREDKPFRGERKERTFGNREDKPFRGERKERTFGNREDKPFRGERKERTFGNREDKPFRGERKERTFGNREDKPFRGERKERTFGNREDKPFRGERKERTFDNREDKPFRGERKERTYANREDKPARKRVVLKETASENVANLEADDRKELIKKLRKNSESILGETRSDEVVDEKEIRINRYLARCGLGSRRDVEKFVQKGDVSVNGQTITDYSFQVQVGIDEVKFKNEILDLPEKDVILAFNKPKGYLSSHFDIHHDKTLFQLLPAKYKRLNIAGRLDLTSRGLMILTSDGDLIQEISHPSKGLEKVYHVTVDSCPDEKTIQNQFLRGIEDGEDFLRARAVEVLDSEKGLVKVVLKEGKKRQLHRMFESLGCKILDLERVQIGKIRLEDLSLEEGHFKKIERDEIISE
ncbi:MAG: pseudouridine synthase [Leptospiraceae bacterium]|nr:pseudouridine synthase [Leptospiraceae bacterium]